MPDIIIKCELKDKSDTYLADHEFEEIELSLTNPTLRQKLSKVLDEHEIRVIEFEVKK